MDVEDPSPVPPLTWEPEHVVDAELAARLVGEQYPDLRGVPVEMLDEGWDNTVHLVGGAWVFRFPRRTVALPLTERELAVLPVLAPRLPLAIPLPERVGVPSESFPWPFWGARLVPGHEMADAGLPDTARSDVARALGAFLRVLHDPQVKDAVIGSEPPLPTDPMGRATPAVRVPHARASLARLARQEVWSPDPAVHRLLDETEPLGPPTAEPVLVHGDLHVRHVLVDGSARACGVIDWGDVCLADPAVDLSIAYSAFAGASRQALLDAYGAVDAEREARARVLAVFLSAALAEYAADEARDRLLQEASAGISRAVAD